MISNMPSRSAADSSALLSRIGDTPLLRLTRLTRHLPPAVEVYAKAEWFNPGGSVKDRPALNMILEGERSGRLAPGKIILDATSGNTGIAYAMIGAARGYRVRLCIASNVSPERKNILRAYGAELVYTDPSESSDGAIRQARAMYAESPELYFYPDQYNNDANWRAHYATTGPEIIAQTTGRVTHFVAGLGTSGTFIGTARRLRDHDPRIKLISFQPDSGFHGLEGLKHMQTAIVPGIYDPAVADRDLAIETEEAYAMTRRLAVEEGMLVGVSSGAAAVCALRVAAELDRGVVVTVFPDSGDKYLSLAFWGERS
jgi:cysteine synthase B